MPKETSQTLRIGVYIIPPVQLLDASPVDIFGSMSRDYMDETPLPEHIRAQGKDISIKYITPGGPSVSALANTTASAALRIDHSIHDAEVQPGCLDIVMVPGPPPSSTFTEEQLDFVRAHWADGKGADVLSVCTGVLVLAASGITTGHTATGPRSELPKLRKRYPDTTWEDKRWSKDASGRLWTSGGITNGQDMVAAYCRDKFGGPFTDIVLAMMDVGERGQEYSSGEVSTTAWWVFTFIRAFFQGSRSSGKIKSK